MDALLADTPLSAHTAEPTDGPITLDELTMAYRCPGMPLDALRYDTTPTGMHYQVMHFDIPETDASTWRLEIRGLVDQRLELSLDDLRSRPSVSQPVTLECAGNGRGLLRPRPVSGPWQTGGVSTAEWTGTPLGPILEEAGVHRSAVDLVFSGADHGVQGGQEQDYQRGLSIADASRDDVLIAYEMNGRPLEPQHGQPLRLVVPGWYGMASVKWLTSIEAIDHAFEGFQNSIAYRYQSDASDPGKPVTRIRVKSLMTPPGIAEFVTGRRFVEQGRISLTGRAWSGEGSITSVEVSIDGEWRPAVLDASLGASAWRGWSCDWEASPGSHELMCRATDSAGNRQPIEQPWNYQGMGNNTVQRLQVVVR